MGRTYSTYIDVDLSDFSDEDLLEELQDRNISPHGSVTPDMIADALLRGRKDQALELMRTYLQDVTGRVLP